MFRDSVSASTYKTNSNYNNKSRSFLAEGGKTARISFLPFFLGFFFGFRFAEIGRSPTGGQKGMYHLKLESWEGEEAMLFMTKIDGHGEIAR